MTPSTTRRALLAGGVMLLAGRAAARQATKLKVYSFGYDVESVMLANEVPRRTEGRYQIEHFTGFDQLTAALGAERVAGGEHALLDGVATGDLDLATIASASAVLRFPEMQVLDVPFVFRDYDHARTVLDGPIGRDLLAKTQSGGALGLAWSENGFRHLTNNKRPVRIPDDVKALKLRTPKSPIIIEGFRSLGAEVTPTPWNQAFFDALAQGVFDAQENTIETIRHFEIFKFQKYLSLTPIRPQPSSSPGPLTTGSRTPTSRRSLTAHGWPESSNVSKSPIARTWRSLSCSARG